MILEESTNATFSLKASMAFVVRGLTTNWEREVEVIRAKPTLPDAKKELEALKEAFHHFYYDLGLSIRAIADLLHKSFEPVRSAMARERIQFRPPHKVPDLFVLGEKEEVTPLVYVPELGTYVRKIVWVPTLEDVYLFGLLFSDGSGYTTHTRGLCVPR